VCILNGIQIWPIDAILHNFQGKSKRAPPICMHSRRATKSVCEQVSHDAYDKKIITIKVGETYAISAKIRSSGFINRILQFFQIVQFLEKHSLDSFASDKTFNLA
jgi:hypothetical protein